MLDLVFANDEFDDQLQFEMSKLLLKFIEANQKLFSLQIQNHLKVLKFYVEEAQRKKMPRHGDSEAKLSIDLLPSQWEERSCA